MATVGMNDLAMRLGGFRLHHGGDGAALLLMGVVALGVLIWALARSDRDQSARS